MTPAVVTALLQVAARSYDEAGCQAVALLHGIRDDDRSLRAARFKEIDELLARTPPGFAETRLQLLRMHYSFSSSDWKHGDRQ
ncbi:hypothetical protein CR152_29320 [Massilia violaceinigra]|uniref:Uncharacterized protein n=2 Tax=Massilia violaceinigra TaxID=2045208 RepID=A0A2D2DT71_9BURK|nr:hypothetical protein CR152_29320 [Massilia violaceinigra]